MSFAFTLFLRFVARDVRRNWVRTILTVFGIALGVSVYLAISIANNTAISQFKQTVSQVSGKANIELMPLSGPAVPESVLSDLADLRALGVKYTPMIDEHLVLASNQNSENSLSGEHSSNSEIVQLQGEGMTPHSTAWGEVAMGTIKSVDNQSGKTMVTVEVTAATKYSK